MYRIGIRNRTVGALVLGWFAAVLFFGASAEIDGRKKGNDASLITSPLIGMPNAGVVRSFQETIFDEGVIASDLKVVSITPQERAGPPDMP